MQCARAIPVAWLGSGSCQNRPSGWILMMMMNAFHLCSNNLFWDLLPYQANCWVPSAIHVLWRESRGSDRRKTVFPLQGHSDVFPSHRKFRADGIHNTFFHRLAMQTAQARLPTRAPCLWNAYVHVTVQTGFTVTPALPQHIKCGLTLFWLRCQTYPQDILPRYRRGDDVIRLIVVRAEGNCASAGLSKFVKI